jgi:hypothetical protein
MPSVVIKMNPREQTIERIRKQIKEEIGVNVEPISQDKEGFKKEVSGVGENWNIFTEIFDKTSRIST